MNKVTFIWSDEGDWVLVYVGEKLVHEGHNIPTHVLCRALGVEYSEIFLEMQHDIMAISHSGLPLSKVKERVGLL